VRRPRMLAAIVAVLATAGAVTARPADVAFATPTPDQASYVVHLRTGERARLWTGTESVTFTNTGTVGLDQVWFRLWANGPGRCREPGIEVTNVTGGTAGALTVRCSALPVTLDGPLAPGATATVGMDIRIRVPRANDRFGRVNGVSMLGNALPLLAVNDDDGWNLEPYAPIGESFYSLVGDFEVTLRVPPEIDTPTTGTLDASVPTPTPPPGGPETRTYVATDVRDFMWVAGELRTRRGVDASGTRVNVWYRPRFLTRTVAERALAEAIRSMDAFSAAFGSYPYAEVDVVVADFRTFGGMEYPQLVLSVPDRYVLAHELAHQWWYGVVGDDQFDEPWVDETFASWSMTYPYSPSVGCQMFEWPSDGARLSNPMSYWLDHPDEYWVIYWQGACMLANLADRFGVDRFLDILNDYAAAHWLGVATTADVQAAFEAAAIEDGLSWDPAAFWDRWRVAPDDGAAPVARGHGTPPRLRGSFD
jgi:Peptidase family M1 domain